MGQVKASEGKEPNCQGNCGTGVYSYRIPSVDSKGIQSIMGRLDMDYGTQTSKYLTDKQNKKLKKADYNGLQ